MSNNERKGGRSRPGQTAFSFTHYSAIIFLSILYEEKNLFRCAAGATTRDEGGQRARIEGPPRRPARSNATAPPPRGRRFGEVEHHKPASGRTSPAGRPPAAASLCLPRSIRPAPLRSRSGAATAAIRNRNPSVPCVLLPPLRASVGPGYGVLFPIFKPPEKESGNRPACRALRFAGYALKTGSGPAASYGLRPALSARGARHELGVQRSRRRPRLPAPGIRCARSLPFADFLPPAGRFRAHRPGIRLHCDRAGDNGIRLLLRRCRRTRRNRKGRRL